MGRPKYRSLVQAHGFTGGHVTLVLDGGTKSTALSRVQRHMASQEVPWLALAVLLASASAAVQLLVLPPAALFASMMPQLVPLDCVAPLVCLLDSQLPELGEWEPA